MVRFLSIVLLGILAAVAYGLVHDQITIRICPQYFTILHPPILPAATSLTVLALAWGVLATWWVGFILGLLLAIAACAGSRPKLGVRELAGPVATLLMIMACGAILAGLAGHYLAITGALKFGPDVSDYIPASAQIPAMTDLCTHLASYGFGFAGGIVLAVRTYLYRGKLARAATVRQAN